MSNHFTMMSHYMLVYNRSHQMMTAPVVFLHKTPHVEDLLCASVDYTPVSLTLQAPLYLQLPNQPTVGNFAKFMVVTVVVLFGLMNLVTLYVLLRDFFLSRDLYDPQFCIRSASASYH